MTLTPYAISISCSLVAPVIVWGTLWSHWRTLALFRRRGRKEVAIEVARRGEQLVGVEDLRVSAVTPRTGLAGVFVLFRVTTQTADGAPRTYDWVYRPALVGRQRRGLKQFSHGIWIALA